MAISLGFTPATTKNGESYGKFKGGQHRTGVKEYTDQKTGEVIEREWSMYCLVFEVQGLYRGTFKDLEVSTNGLFTHDSDLYKALVSMGWTAETPNITEDEKGLPMISIGEEDDKGLSVIEDFGSIEDDVFAFLDSKIGQAFWLKVVKEGRFYKIKPDSLRPFE